MIAHVSGEVVEKTNTALIIDVGGIGYEVQVAASDFESAILGQKHKFFTFDHLRENSHELFGFSNLAAKRLFESLISVSGVGPKMALTILSLGESEVIRSAIANGESSFIQKASGVGKRIAERIVVDLRDKVGVPSAGNNMTELQTDAHDDALDALLALGYSMQQAGEMLSQVDPSLDIQTKIKLALSAA